MQHSQERKQRPRARRTCALLLLVGVLSSLLYLPASAAVSDFVVEPVVVNFQTTFALIAYNGPGGHVVIPEEISIITEEVFKDRTDITGVTFPNVPFVIGPRAFMGSGLTSVTVPATVVAIGNDAFNGCTALVKADIQTSMLRDPDGYAAKLVDAAKNYNTYAQDYFYSGAPGDGLFMYCANLEEVTFAEGVKTITAGTFYGCKNLTDVTLPNSAERIESTAFLDCSRLASLTLPKGLKSVHNLAFKGCTALSQVELPAGADGIERGAFQDTPWFKRLERQDGFAIANGLLLAYDGPGGQVTIPSTVARIQNEVFQNRTDIIGVTFPDDLLSIGVGAFYGCTQLSGVTLPSGVHLWGGAFSKCTNLKDVTIPPDITDLDYKFDNCPNLVVHGAAGSYAETWAMQNRYPFVADLGNSKTEEGNTAYYRQQVVLLNSNPCEFDMYALKDVHGNETNYVQVRDVAQALSGTPAQFDVSWNGAVNIQTGKAYTPVPSNGALLNLEMIYRINTAPIQVNGKETALSAIVLNDSKGGGHTYFKLRDLGEALGFGVDWNSALGKILINTGVADEPVTGKIINEEIQSSQTAGGTGRVIFIKEDGSVWDWTAATSWGKAETLVQIEGVDKAASVTLQENVAAVLKTDGTVMTWDESSRSGLQTVMGLSDVVSIQAQKNMLYALKADGTVWNWVLGGTPQKIESLKQIKSLSVGNIHWLAADADGRVWAGGRNLYGALGTKNGFDSDYPEQVPGLSNIVSVAAGDTHSLALSADGQVYAWGENSFGALGCDNGFKRSHTPLVVPGLKNVTAVSAGDNSMALTKSGEVYVWGSEMYGWYKGGGGKEFGDILPIPVKVTGISKAVSISSGCHIVTETGELYGQSGVSLSKTGASTKPAILVKGVAHP